MFRELQKINTIFECTVCEHIFRFHEGIEKEYGPCFFIGDKAYFDMMCVKPACPCCKKQFGVEYIKEEKFMKHWKRISFIDYVKMCYVKRWLQKMNKDKRSIELFMKINKY